MSTCTNCTVYCTQHKQYILGVHCANNNLNIRIKIEPVTAEADATVYVRLFVTDIRPRYQTFTVASAPTMAGSVYLRRFI